MDKGVHLRKHIASGADGIAEGEVRTQIIGRKGFPLAVQVKAVEEDHVPFHQASVVAVEAGNGSIPILEAVGMQEMELVIDAAHRILMATGAIGADLGPARERLQSRLYRRPRVAGPKAKAKDR